MLWVSIEDEINKLYNFVESYYQFFEEIGSYNYRHQIVNFIDEFFLLALYNKVARTINPDDLHLEYDDTDSNEKMKKLIIKIVEADNTEYIGKLGNLLVDTNFDIAKGAKEFYLTLTSFDGKKDIWGVTLDLSEGKTKIFASFTDA
jgi:hypothetical protein